MKKNLVKNCVWLCALAFAFYGSALLPAAAADKKALAPDEIPAPAKGFAGSLEGTVISKDDTGTTFILKVEKANTLAKYAQYNKAKKPDALKGKKVLIYVRWSQVKGTKTFAPGEDYLQFVKGLKIDGKTSVDVYSDAYNRLIMVEVPKESASK